MPATFTKGDVFHTQGLRTYAHGCSCAGAMDAGVSVAFKKRFPRMFDEYRLRCEDGRFRLGDVFVWSEGDETVFNLAIQEHWKKKPAYPALARSLEKMLELATAAGIARIGMPRLGAGPLGLDWTRAKRIVAKAAEASPVELVVFEQFVRAPGD